MLKSTNNSTISNVRVIDSNYKSQKDNIKQSHHTNSDCSNKKDNCASVEGNVVDNCENTTITPTGVSTGVIAKIPVVLSELDLQFNISSMINLPEPALEVKDITKKLKITQCMLLQPTNILFVKGYIRKNIDYSTGTCSNIQGVCGEVHHCTVDVPFECSTAIDFFTEPEDLILNTKSEFEYSKVSKLPNQYFAEKDKLLSGDLSEFNQFMTEDFNELPYCELINARIFEFDEYIGRKIPCNANLPFGEKFFSQIEEKMVVRLRIKLLQNKQVNISATGSSGFHCASSSKD